VSRDSAALALPLFRRFPKLATLPRVRLGRFPTPVTPAPTLGDDFWVKRDDLSADPIGGNKVRALEFLLGRVARGDTIVTIGSAGSTHALAVAMYGKRLGARVIVGRWRQVMNAQAERVAERLSREADEAPVFRTPIGAYLWARLQRARGATWIPAGGRSPLGTLGHVNAGLELADQIAAGRLPVPRHVVVPLGTGGTAAGLALGFAIAGVDTTVVGARVVPRLIGRERRVASLVASTARLIEDATGARLPRLAPSRFVVAHESYGGAYGLETESGRTATGEFRAWSGLELDATYSAKACAVALSLASGVGGRPGDGGGGGPRLFWLTFDSRILGAS
jgi:D-cysteine desulfhydrase